MTEELSTIKVAIARGKQRFFEQYPHLLQEADDILGTTKPVADDHTEAQEIARYRVMARTAKANRMDTVMMLLQLGTDSQEELERLVQLQNAKMSTAFGL